MILPIHVYGDPVLREPTEPVGANSEATQRLIDDMIETMHGAAGIGLAAPQVGRSERLFIIDLRPMLEELSEDEQVALPEQPMVFINPEIVAESRETCDFEEGCLSIPELRESVTRPERIRIEYLDRDFEPRELETGGFLARVLQHEYDHLEGVLFTDLISSFRKKLLKRRLRDMQRGNVEADYPLTTDETEPERV